jgi:hypothetical protein
MKMTKQPEEKDDRVSGNGLRPLPCPRLLKEEKEATLAYLRRNPVMVMIVPRKPGRKVSK